MLLVQTMLMRVLIIIPAFNEEKNVLATVNSIKEYSDYDYIVIKNHEENYQKNNVLLMQVMTIDSQNNFVLLNTIQI